MIRRSFEGVEYEPREGVAIIRLRNPPVNGLSHAVRSGLLAAFRHASEDPEAVAVVLTGSGRGFSAGGDFAEAGSPAAKASPQLSRDVHPVIEMCPKPTIAALHGFAIGGALETALACHFRLAAGDTRIALPEIRNLGLIPLSGTQRLPRVLGVSTAIDFILEGRTMLAGDSVARPLFDELIDADGDGVVEHAVGFALRVLRDSRPPWPLIRHRPYPAEGRDVLEAARRRALQIGPAASAAVEAIAAGASAADFDAGLQHAREIFDGLRPTPPSRASSLHRRDLPSRDPPP